MSAKIYYKNPRVDDLIIFPNLKIVPTKQDKFKPIEIEGYSNIYELKPDTHSVQYLDGIIRSFFVKNNFKLIPQNVPVEIALSIGTDTIKRYNNVDVDNLAKAILDCLNGCVLEDDSQVQKLICTKYVDNTLNWHSITIAITKIENKTRGILKNMNLFSDQPYPENY